jgi:hypothetical protein
LFVNVVQVFTLYPWVGSALGEKKALRISK